MIKSADNQNPEPHSSPLYGSFAPAYRALWPAIGGKNIRNAIESSEIRPQDRVLEVGVGTGISLSHYPKSAQITGVDLSDAMLAEAQALVDRHGWQHVRLLQMNAEKLTFEDSSFDLVTAFHTISVVTNPMAMMRELVRVCRPGGRIVLLNHFRSDNPLIARFVDSAGNLTKRLGWRTDLELEQVVRELPIRIDDSYKPSPLSLFTVLRATVLEADRS